MPNSAATQGPAGVTRITEASVMGWPERFWGGGSHSLSPVLAAASAPPPPDAPPRPHSSVGCTPQPQRIAVRNAVSSRCCTTILQSWRHAA